MFIFPSGSAAAGPSAPSLTLFAESILPRETLVRQSVGTQAVRKGQTRVFIVACDSRGEARIVQRAFSLGPSAQTETGRFVDQRLNVKAA